MKIIAVITGFYFNGLPNTVHYLVQFGVSDGTYSSSGDFTADPADTEAQQVNAVKIAVAAAVNAALGTSLGQADVRLM